MAKVIELIHGALEIAVKIQAASGPKLVDFKVKLKEEEFSSLVDTLRTKVEQFAVNFRLPGHDDI